MYINLVVGMFKNLKLDSAICKEVIFYGEMEKWQCKHH